MKRFQFTQLTSALALLVFSPLSHAAAFQFYELGAPINGTAGVGQAALANDASTAYYNPAGMTFLSSTQVMLGTQFILPYTNFSPNSANTIAGNNGANAGLLAPGLGGYFVYQLSPRLSAGINVNSPYGGALSYNSRWVGRYIAQQVMFYTVDANPALAYQVNKWLSLGVGYVMEYANLNQSIALPIQAGLDGQANLKLDNFASGFNLGVIIAPDAATKLGITYRSQVVHHLNGNTSFLNITATPTTHSKMVMPTNITASISRALTSKFTLLGEVGWADWSTMRNTIVTIDRFSAVTPNNWHNTMRVGLGGRYQLRDALLVQTGVSYDSSPTTTSQRLPDLPVDAQVRAGVGLEYAFIKQATLGASYEYLHLGSAAISNTSAMGVLSGSYPRNYANVVQVSLNVIC